MKNKKGFTLVELLAVVVILGLIILVTIPAVNRFILNSKEKAFSFAQESMETAAKNYLTECERYVYGEDNEELRYCEGITTPKKDKETATISLSDLIKNGYLEPIEDPGKTDEYCYAEDSYVVVENIGGDSLNYKLTYTAKLFCPSNEYDDPEDSQNVNSDFHVLVNSYIGDPSDNIKYDYGTWTKSNITVVLSASHFTGTIDRYEWKEFGSTTWTTAGGANHDTVVFETSMNKKIQFRGVTTDNEVSANVNEFKVYRIDNAPPGGEIKLVGDKNVNEDGVLFKTNVVAKCGNVGDNGSGLKSCGVSTTKGDYKQSVSFTNDALTYTVYMQAIDKIGNVYETEKTFGIDKYVPTLSSLVIINPDGTPYESGTWTKETLRIKGLANDNLKVDKIIYNPSDTDEVALSPSEYFEMNTTRQATLTVTARDAAWHVSGNLTVDVKIDKDKPVIQSVNGLDGDYVKTRTVTVNAQDTGGSGLHAQAYSFDNGATWQSSNTKVYTSNADINIKVRDSVGNISDVYSHSIKNVDSTAPVITSVTGNPTDWAKEATVTITASDDLSGLPASPYSFDNCAHWQASPNKKYTANATFTICVRDNLGNKATYNYSVTKVDSAGPTITSIDGNTPGYSASKTLTINASDGLSGLHATPYSFDDGANWQTSKSKTYTTNETVKIAVRDKLGNVTKQTVTISNVDKDAPTISGVTGNPTDWAKSATLVVNASDSGAGLHSQAYSFDNGSTWQQSNSKSYTANATVNIKVRDVAGNISSVYKVEITKVDSQAETISVTGNPTNWATSATLAISVTTKGPSGLHETPYSWDNGSTWGKDASKKFTSSQTVNVKVRDKAGNITSQSVNVNKVDGSKPSCSTSKSSCGSGGCTVKITCSDSGGSGIKECAGGSTSPQTKTGVKSETTYTVKDNAGNSDTCKVTISKSSYETGCYYVCYENWNYTYGYQYCSWCNCRNISGSACCTGTNTGYEFKPPSCGYTHCWACNGGNFTCPSDWPGATKTGCTTTTTYS